MSSRSWSTDVGQPGYVGQPISSPDFFFRRISKCSGKCWWYRGRDWRKRGCTPPVSTSAWSPECRRLWRTRRESHPLPRLQWRAKDLRRTKTITNRNLFNIKHTIYALYTVVKVLNAVYRARDCSLVGIRGRLNHIQFLRPGRSELHGLPYFNDIIFTSESIV